MFDLHTIISEARSEGIGLTRLKEKSNLKKAVLDDQIKQLRAQHLIAGPFRTGKGNLFYAKGYEPSVESVGSKIEDLIRDGGTKLQSKSQLEEKIKSPFKKFFKDAIRVLVAGGRVAELKGGQSAYLLHVDAVRQLFPEIGTVNLPQKIERPSSSLKEQVLNAYHALKAEQGGLSAVSIGKLRNRVGCPTQALHALLLEEARSGNADLHPTTLVDLSAEDREGVLPIPGTSEPAVTVTLR